MLLKISHRTDYHYSQPVVFGDHECRLRPLEGHDLKIVSSMLSIQPHCHVRWMNDVYNNSVALVEFLCPSNDLTIDSLVTVKQYNISPFDFTLSPTALSLPMHYTPEVLLDISGYIHPHYSQDAHYVREWIKPFLDGKGNAATMDFLIRLNESVCKTFTYIRRDEYGVQTPGETFQKQSGSCRDFALLFMEAARSMGLAARFVSGYLYCEGFGQTVAECSTHAWTEIFLPGAGWKGFDPTCGRLADSNHIRVAVAREPAQAPPISGSYTGGKDIFLGMKVKVSVEQLPDEPAAPLLT